MSDRRAEVHALLIDAARLRAAWDSAKHPRDRKGEFAHLPGTSTLSINPKGRRTGPIADEQAEANLQSVFDAAKSTPSYKVGMNWYAHSHDLIGQHAKKLGIDPQTFAGMVAATSPQVMWETKGGRLVNIELAEKAHRAAQAYPGKSGTAVAAAIKSPGMLRHSLADAVDIDNGMPVGEALGGPKTRSFYNNLTAVNATQDVTIDTHMVHALAGQNHLSNTELQAYARGAHYSWSADRVRAIAAKNHITPAQAQAIIWDQTTRTGG